MIKKKKDVRYLPNTLIPVRPLTEEEATRDITIERVSAFNAKMGENFLDSRGGDEVDKDAFGGFLMAKRPELSSKILEIMNDKYGEMLSYEEMFQDLYSDTETGNLTDWETPYNEFYSYYCEFVNQTTSTKKRLNEVLIMLTEDEEINYEVEEEIVELDGSSIPLRELTTEEAEREITFERFHEWMCEVGEDFVDQHAYGDARIFLGFVIAKYFNLSKKLLDMFNKGQRLFHIQDILHFFEDEFGHDEVGFEKFYTIYADFINHTEHTKKKVNEQLIITMEYYKH